MLQVDQERGGHAAYELVRSIYDDLATADPTRRTADAIAVAVAVVLEFAAKAGADPVEFMTTVNARLADNGVPWRIGTAG